MNKRVSALKKACKQFDHHVIEVNTYTNEIIRIRDREHVETCFWELVKEGVMIYVTGGENEH